MQQVQQALCALGGTSCFSFIAIAPPSPPCLMAWIPTHNASLHQRKFVSLRAKTYQVVKEDLKEDEAEAMKAKLESVGATVELE